MSRYLKRVAPALGCAAISVVVVAGPASAHRPDPSDRARDARSGQADRVRAELDGFRGQGAVLPIADPSSAPSPIDLPLLPIGIGAAAIVVLAAGAAGMRRRMHGPQPV